MEDEYRQILKAFAASTSPPTLSSLLMSARPAESPQTLLLSQLSTPSNSALASDSEFGYHKLKIHPKTVAARDERNDREAPFIAPLRRNSTLTNSAGTYDNESFKNVSDEESILDRYYYDKQISSKSPTYLAGPGPINGTEFDLSLRRYLSSLKHLHLQDGDNSDSWPDTGYSIPLSLRRSPDRSWCKVRRPSHINDEEPYRETIDYHTASTYPSNVKDFHEYYDKCRTQASLPITTPNSLDTAPEPMPNGIHPDVIRGLSKISHDQYRAALVSSVDQKRHLTDHSGPQHETVQPMSELIGSISRTDMHSEEQGEFYTRSREYFRGPVQSREQANGLHEQTSKVRANSDRHRLQPYPRDYQLHRTVNHLRGDISPRPSASSPTRTMTSSSPPRFMSSSSSSSSSSSHHTIPPMPKASKGYQATSRSLAVTIHGQLQEGFAHQDELGCQSQASKVSSPLEQLLRPPRSHANEALFSRDKECHLYKRSHMNGMYRLSSLKSCTVTSSTPNDICQSTLDSVESSHPQKEWYVGNSTEGNPTTTLLRHDGSITLQNNKRNNTQNTEGEKVFTKDPKTSPAVKEDIHKKDMLSEANPDLPLKMYHRRDRKRVETQENDSKLNTPSKAHGKTDVDGSSKLTCTFCFDKFSTQRAYDKHMASKHKAEKPNICGFCGKGFQDKFDLKRHNRTHTGDNYIELTKIVLA